MKKIIFILKTYWLDYVYILGCRWVPVTRAFHSLVISCSKFPLWFFPATQANVPVWIRWDYLHDWLALTSLSCCCCCCYCWRCHFRCHCSIRCVDRLPIYHHPISDISVARTPSPVASAYVPFHGCRWTSERICNDAKYRKISAPFHVKPIGYSSNCRRETSSTPKPQYTNASTIFPPNSLALNDDNVPLVGTTRHHLRKIVSSISAGGGRNTRHQHRANGGA